MKIAVIKAFSKVKRSSKLSLYSGTNKTMKNAMEKRAKTKDDKQTEEKVEVTPQKDKRALKAAHKSFEIPGLSEAQLIVMLCMY